MSRKHTRRKHWPLVNPVRMAILGAAPASNDLLDEIRLRNLSSRYRQWLARQDTSGTH